MRAGRCFDFALRYFIRRAKNPILENILQNTFLKHSGNTVSDGIEDLEVEPMLEQDQYCIHKEAG
jgi:hypothetical protein